MNNHSPAVVGNAYIFSFQAIRMEAIDILDHFWNGEPAASLEDRAVRENTRIYTSRATSK